jgi:hypothetical protein
VLYKEPSPGAGSSNAVLKAVTQGDIPNVLEVRASHSAPVHCQCMIAVGIRVRMQAFNRTGAHCVPHLHFPGKCILVADCMTEPQ